MSLTSIEKYDPFFIEGIQDKILSFIDPKTIINLKNTNKQFNKIEEPYTTFYINCRISRVPICIINFLSSKYYIRSIEYNNFDAIFRRKIYYDFFSKLVKTNIYKARFTHIIPVIMNDYDSDSRINRAFKNKDDYIIFLCNILNKNIDQLENKNRIDFWKSILNLGCSPIIGKYDEITKFYLKSD